MNFEGTRCSLSGRIIVKDRRSANIHLPPPPSPSWGAVFPCPTDFRLDPVTCFSQCHESRYDASECFKLLAPFSLTFALWSFTISPECPPGSCWRRMRHGRRPGPNLQNAAKLSWNHQKESPTHLQEIHVLSHWVVVCLKLLLHSVIVPVANQYDKQ